jgi:hypothetical protein
MTVGVAVSCSVFSIHLGRFEVFIQRKTAPGTSYGFTRGLMSGDTLDRPGLSNYWASL